MNAHDGGISTRWITPEPLTPRERWEAREATARARASARLDQRAALAEAERTVREHADGR
jgi:hypothetical protein